METLESGLMNGMSVIVCCYNSSARLPETLRHLSLQDYSGAWELILVDNASTDGTATAALHIWNDLGDKAPLKIVSEQTPGLSFARKAGIANASFELVVFCDDDNWLAADYLTRAWHIMNENIGVGICGGISEPAFEDGLGPEWFAKYQLVFGCGEQSRYEGILGMDSLALYGAGMVVRKKIFDILQANNYHFLLTGRMGNKTIAGEDYELAVLARALGFQLYYSKSLFFRHFMPKARMTWKQLVKTVHGSALSSAVAFIYADELRYQITGEIRYKVSWAKDILKVLNSARLVRVTKVRDLEVVWARLRAGLFSVLSNIPNYNRYKMHMRKIYQLAHSKD